MNHILKKRVREETIVEVLELLKECEEYAGSPADVIGEFRERLTSQMGAGN